MPLQQLSGVEISPREAEVLALVGEHLTNAEIAERLFISVRTVETHVASLLRKVGVPDKRALAVAAGSIEPAVEPVRTMPGVRRSTGLPTPLTSFIGRATEREALAQLLKTDRLVTVIGPGGVGKTRLAVAVASEIADDFEAVWFVDLVPVTDAAMIPAAVAGALGVADQPGRPLVESIASWVGRRRVLVVLDNTEHLLDGASPVVERLLTECPELVVLATSRARLMLPFERVFNISGLSLPEGDECGDAVALFLARAEAVGAERLGESEQARVGAIVRQLDGIALAVELAASRLPSLGLDGLEAGLIEPLRLLSGGSRIQGRHQSLRATFEWSWSLLDDDQRSLLDQVSVFASPFTARDAAQVVDPPQTAAAVAEGLSRLADSSLLVARPDRAGTRYRALEEVRQYGVEQLAGAAVAALRERHVRWCLAEASLLAGRSAGRDAGWRDDFDVLADEIRAALRGADPRAGDHDAWRLTLLLADLSFARGTPREAARRYEQAAGLAPTPEEQLTGLQDAARAAIASQSGENGVRLLEAAAALADELGDIESAGVARSLAAEIILRAPGIFTMPLPEEDAEPLINAARGAEPKTPRVEAAIAVATAFAPPLDVESARLAFELARRADDPVLTSAALDALTSSHLDRNEIAEATEAVRLRTSMLDTFPRDARKSWELIDGYLMAADVALGAGDLVNARRFADSLAALPFVSEEPYLTMSRQLRVGLFVGDVAEVIAQGEEFRESWECAGRPVIGQLGASAWAVAAAYGLAGDDDQMREWIAICRELRSNRPRIDEVFGTWQDGAPPVMDALVLLHRGDHEGARARLPEDPNDFGGWCVGMWRPWCTALVAEASALSGSDDPAKYRDRPFVLASPVATAIVDRSIALAEGDIAGVLATAAAFEAADCRYQHARTLVLAGGSHREQGIALMTDLGVATPPR